MKTFLDDLSSAHKIPAHFFERGDYEVWSNGRLIANNVCLETARAYNWPNKVIKLNGEIVV